MKKPRAKPRRNLPRNKGKSGPTGSRTRLLMLLVPAALVVVAIGVSLRLRSIKPPTTGSYRSHPPGTLTFHKDVAPIVLDRCAYCHRPGQSAPFPLLTYAEVKKHAKQIADVTSRRYMPPWLPEPGYGEFTGVRRLTEDQLGVIQQWVAEGAIEGNPKDGPPTPQWPEGWQLGEPDLVVKMPQAYVLAAEGKDVYRNVVIPIPLSERRYVKAVEFQPGNAKVIHHAFINVDQTRESRRLAEKQNPPGFDGMELPETAIMVAGQMLGWQPGKQAEATGEGLSWPLEKNSDLVLQLHLHPTGKPEQVQSAVGFYFTSQPPAKTPFRLYLPVWRIDIPAGAGDYAVENSYVLPVDVDVLRVSPHAHYVAKEMQGYAILPDGTKRWMLLIKDWDFNWQGDYRYAEPVFLPKGTKVAMHFTYDNSTNNLRNPNRPPQRIRYGLQTTDEMAELIYQVVPRNAEDLALLRKDYFAKMTLQAVDYNEGVLRERPDDARAHAKLGQALLALGRNADSFEHLRAAIRLNPNDDKPHYDLGTLYLMRNQLAEAKTEFETVLRLQPDDYQAHGNLGTVYRRLGDLEQAQAHFSSALRLNPDDAIAKRNLERTLEARRGAQSGH